VRTFGRIVALAAAVAAVPIAAMGAPAPAPKIEPPAVVLAKYEEALDHTVGPRFVRFEYAVEQVGPHNLSQTHRVYRSGLNERDEILSIDGQPLPVPSIRIFRNRLYRYNVTALAPRARDYEFSYVGRHRDGVRFDYVFSAVPRAEAGSAYSVLGLTLDGVHFMPRTIAYSTTAGGVRGKGTLTFSPQGNHWMIQEATVTAKIDGKIARERLVFHNYDFPPSLPNSTFVEPHTAPTPQP